MKGAIVYVTSNREDPCFESRVIEDLLKKRGDLPVVCVSQKPMVTGIHEFFNEVVGDVGTSGFNFCRQLQIAISLTEADYVISCEADCLYSPDYFKFVPPRLDAVYRNTNNYVLPYQKDYFQYKNSQTAFQIAGADFLMNRLNYLFLKQPKWNTEMKSFPKEIGKPFLESWETFKTNDPCITIKTGNGMRKHTNSDKEQVFSLPYWGTAKQVREKYL